MSDNEMREAFEALIENANLNLLKLTDGSYFDHHTNVAFQVFQHQQAKIEELTNDYQDIRINNDLFKHRNKILGLDLAELQKTVIAQQAEIERLRQPVSDAHICEYASYAYNLGRDAKGFKDAAAIEKFRSILERK